MAAPLTFGELRQGTTSWVRRDLNRTLRVGAISFAVSWLVNFIVITNWGAALGNVIGGATNGTQGVGAAYMAIMSLVVTSLIVYGMEAGWSDLRKSFVAIPKAVGRMFRQHGVRMWSIIFWGTAVTLLTSGILDPTLAAAFGLGFLAFAPTAITGLLGKLITGVWMWVIGLVAPKARPHAPGLGGQLVGMVGAGFGFLLASQATETAFQLIAAGALVALSYFVLLNSSSKVTSTSAFMLIGLAFWIAGEGIAHAVQGCCEESYHALDPGLEAAGLSAIAGLAGGVAGILGAGVGSVLATHPMDPSLWDDAPPSDRPVVTADPIPEGPTRPTTIVLEGDAARDTLAAWQKANADGGQVDLGLPDGDQWGGTVSDPEGTTARTDFTGTRGRVTGVGPVVTGDDGSISISVDVTAYTPPAPVAPSAPPVAGMAPTVPTADEPPPEVPSDMTDDEPPPAPTAGVTPPAPDVGEVIADSAAAERRAPSRKPPDGSNPGTYAEWMGRVANGTLPPADITALDGLIRGTRTEVTVSGTLIGRWAPMVGATEPRTDGVAFRFPTGDRILIRVGGGQIEIKHEASLVSLFADAVADSAGEAGVKIPKIESMVAGARGPIDGFNRAIAGSGRQVESISRNPDGSITIRTRPAG